RFAPERFPVFNLEAPQGQYYGFPIWSIPGFKIGRYHHLQEVIDPDAMEREPNAVDEAALRDGVARYFPDANGPVMTARACIFTNTPDEHFIIDTLPDAPNVIVASPCSGHGFKFAAVVGEIIADLVVEGGTRHDIGLFRLERFAASQGGERSGRRAEAAALEA
ncbi:MAG: FAD-dependent oxidoreductase, partial [Thermomicrobiales bacterium]|nr:FAD-dependent oxidoreductase [Thermomicrobiales bacterium]